MKNFEKKNEKKLEVQISQMKEEYETKIHENSNVIKSLEKLKEKDMQRILQLEGENKKCCGERNIRRGNKKCCRERNIRRNKNCCGERNISRGK